MFTMSPVYTYVYTHAQKEISKYIVKYSKESFLLNKYFSSSWFLELFETERTAELAALSSV